MQYIIKKWYVLFVRTGLEDHVKNRLRKLVSDEEIRFFVPKKECIYRRKGQKSIFHKICFPGYVFIETNKSQEVFRPLIIPIIANLKDVYRFLHYGSKIDIAMADEERLALSRILGTNHCIDISVGFKQGDLVRITSGALVGNESKILRINRGRHEAVVQVQMFGSTIPVTVGLEFIEKSNKDIGKETRQAHE